MTEGYLTLTQDWLREPAQQVGDELLKLAKAERFREKEDDRPAPN